MLSERSESGLAGIRHNGVDYLVRKNVFGDITRLYAPDGGVAARYDYDAWGNPRITVSGGHRVGELNPFLYRGYCYDRETGYYYLRTRYYDPEACRFLSPDDPSLLALTGDHANGIMSYTYCADNPVMEVDDDGQMPKWLKWLLLGVVTVVAVAAVAVGTVMTGGGVVVALFGSVLSGAGWGFIGSAATNIIIQGNETNWNWNEINPSKALLSGGIGAGIGAIGGLGSGLLGFIGKQSGQFIGMALSEKSLFGLNLAKAFSLYPGAKGFSLIGGANFFMAFGGFIGKSIGAITGVTFANEFANNLFGYYPGFIEDMEDSVVGFAQDWFTDWLFRWIRWIRK